MPAMQATTNKISCECPTCVRQDRLPSSEFGVEAGLSSPPAPIGRRKPRPAPQIDIAPTLAPPQTNSVCPVTKLFSGSRKNSMARVRHRRLSPIRPTGMRAARSCWRGLSFSITPQKLSVRTGPGATTLTVIPCGRQFQRPGPGHADDPGLGRTIGRPGRCAHRGRAAGIEDDPPKALRPSSPAGTACVQLQRRSHVKLGEPGDILCLGVLKQVWPDQPGIVDQPGHSVLGRNALCGTSATWRSDPSRSTFTR